MKIALAAAAFALSVSSAFACSYKNVSAALDVPMTVASAEQATTPIEPATDEVTTGSIEEEKAE